MLKLYQFKEQNRKAEQGETWIIFTLLHRSLCRLIINDLNFIFKNAHYCVEILTTWLQ